MRLQANFLLKNAAGLVPPTATSVVNALAKAGIELGENGSIFPRPKGKPR